MRTEYLCQDNRKEARPLPHVFDHKGRGHLPRHQRLRPRRRGVFTDEHGDTYAGQCKDGHACGLGVLTWSYNGSKFYAEHGPDGRLDGRCLYRDADGDTGYYLCERGKVKDYVTLT
jgi:hypothetical protein